MAYIQRKSLLYKTAVEYGDYTINHVEGCSHGCLYPCYAFLMAKRFGKIKTYKEWIQPKIVHNALELLDKEIPKYKNDIKFVQLSFTTDPFMYNYPEVSKLSYEIIKKLNDNDIKCTALTKGILPIKLANISDKNEFGITLITINDNYRQELEPFASPMNKRIKSLYSLHKKGLKTWVSIEPYPTPNIINQDINKILDRLSFVDKFIFGRLNYNAKVSKYDDYKNFFNEMALSVVSFAKKNNKQYYIKKGTLTNSSSNSEIYSKTQATNIFCNI